MQEKRLRGVLETHGSGHPGVEVGCCGLVFTRCGFISLSGSPRSPTFIPHQLPPALPPQVLAGTLAPCTGHHRAPGAPRARAGVRPESPRTQHCALRRQQEACSALGLGLPSVPWTQTRRVSIRVRERWTYKPGRGEGKSREIARRSGLFPRWRLYFFLSLPFVTAFFYYRRVRGGFTATSGKTERQEHQSLDLLSWIVIYRPKGT